jgi:hypothetical protein
LGQFVLLTRQFFFHIQQCLNISSSFIINLVHMLLATHDPMNMSAEVYTTRFFDGLRSDIRFVVVVQRPHELLPPV